MKKIFENKKIYYFILIFFILGITIRPLLLIYNQKDNFFSRNYSKQYESLKSSYYNSQYVKKKNPEIIPDEIFEAFAGGAFLKGMNPILIVHDHPPLGRYFVSLSIFLFNNANTIIIPLLITSVLGVFFISKAILKNILLSLIPVLIFTNEPLFLNKLVYYPLPEPIQFPFIIFSLYFFIKGVTNKKYIKWFILTSIMIGFVISTRFFILGLSLVSLMFFYLFLFKREIKRSIIFILCLPLSLVVLILSYAKTIQDGYSLLQIIGIQKYIFVYQKTKFGQPFSFWDLILFNRWHTWWGDRIISFDNQWIILWPVSMILSFMALILSLIKKLTLSEPEKIVLGWIIFYSLMLSTGSVSTRYFLPLLPFLYIIAISFLYKLIKELSFIKLNKKHGRKKK